MHTVSTTKLARVPAEGAPVLDCRLTSSTTGADIPLVPDYVPTNRYETKDARVGVLIYSTTIENPGLHTLSCNYPDERVSPRADAGHWTELLFMSFSAWPGTWVVHFLEVREFFVALLCSRWASLLLRYFNHVANGKSKEG